MAFRNRSSPVSLAAALALAGTAAVGLLIGLLGGSAAGWGLAGGALLGACLVLVVGREGGDDSGTVGRVVPVDTVAAPEAGPMDQKHGDSSSTLPRPSGSASGAGAAPASSASTAVAALAGAATAATPPSVPRADGGAMGDEGGNGAERRLSTQLQTLNQLAMTLNSETDPGRMLDEVLAGALRLTGAAGGSFYLVDAGALRLEAFTLAVSSGERSSAGRSGVSDAKDLARKALAEQRMIRVPPTGSGGGSGPGYLAVPLVTWDGGELACLVLTGLGRESAFSAEDEVLTATLAAHTSVALQNAQRLARERETAEYLQRAMLPEAVRPVGLEIEWAYESATDATLVGGDFYDVLPLSGGRTALVVGDVSGKGLVAATRMATVRHMFRAFVPLDPGPGEWLRLVSEGIASSLTSSEFVTATLVVVDPERGHMECAIAGHPAPLVALPSGVTEIEVEPGLPLGMGRQWAYADRQMDLPQGCTLILYTDGLYEARNGGRMFGADRLEAAARALASAPLSGAADRLVAEARVHAGGSLSDDVVVVLARPRTSSRR